MKHRSILGFAALALAGCSHEPLGRSIEQEVRVETPGCARVRCELRNDKGTWVVTQTPGQARVHTSDRPLEVSCRALDAASGTTRSQARQRPLSDGAAVAGAALGGGVAAAAMAPAAGAAAMLGGPFTLLIGALVVAGAAGGGSIARAVDAAQREFRYPAVVRVPLQCEPPSLGAATLAAATWGLAVRGAQPEAGVATGAVRVLAVAPGGRAATAGLQAGDLLLAIDGRPLAGTRELEDALRAPREPIVLRVQRAAEELQLILPPPGGAR
jgi:hypothetical protein